MHAELDDSHNFTRREMADMKKKDVCDQHENVLCRNADFCRGCWSIEIQPQHWVLGKPVQNGEPVNSQDAGIPDKKWMQAA